MIGANVLSWYHIMIGGDGLSRCHIMIGGMACHGITS